MRVHTCKAFVTGCLAFACLAVFSLAHLDRAALALTAREAESVVNVLEKLKADGMQIAYDDESADDWFEQDSDDKKLITKAGFNQKTWKVAADETMTGFFASIPEAELKSTFDNLRKRLEASAGMTAAQKAAMREVVEEQYAKVNALRAQGKPFVAAVTPLVPRLRKLAFD